MLLSLLFFNKQMQWKIIEKVMKEWNLFSSNWTSKIKANKDVNKEKMKFSGEKYRQLTKQYKYY